MKKKGFDKFSAVREKSRRIIGSLPRTKVIPNKKKKDPKHKNSLEE